MKGINLMIPFDNKIIVLHLKVYVKSLLIIPLSSFQIFKQKVKMRF